MKSEVLDLVASVGETTGPQWGTATSDLNGTLLSWNEGQEVPAHVNSEVDVMMVVVHGKGTLTLDGELHQVHEGMAAVIPKGVQRAVAAHSTPFVYLNIHRRRSLQLTSPPPRPNQS
jgi:quercetin dioxygenase-like cupin family protein